MGSARIPPCPGYIAYIQSVLFFARDAEKESPVARHFPPSRDSDLDRLLQTNALDGAHASHRNPWTKDLPVNTPGARINCLSHRKFYLPKTTDKEYQNKRKLLKRRPFLASSRENLQQHDWTRRLKTPKTDAAVTIEWRKAAIRYSLKIKIGKQNARPPR